MVETLQITYSHVMEKIVTISIALNDGLLWSG